MGILNFFSRTPKGPAQKPQASGMGAAVLDRPQMPAQTSAVDLDIGGSRRNVGVNRISPHLAGLDNAARADNFPADLNFKNPSLTDNLSAFENKQLKRFENVPWRDDLSVITFDLDETIEHASEKGLNVDKAKKNGYEVLRSNTGVEFVIRPGTMKLFKTLRMLGHKIVVQTNNLKGYAEDVLGSCPDGRYVNWVVAHEDITTPENYDYAKYPHHPNNIGMLGWAKDFFYRCTFGLWKCFVVQGFKFLFGKTDRPPYFPKRDKKYPRMHNSYLIFDNSPSKHTAARKKKAYVAVNPGEFNCTKPADSMKDANGEYKWVNKVLDDVYAARTSGGWQYLFEREYGEKPIDIKVPLSEYAQGSKLDIYNGPPLKESETLSAI